MPTYKIDRGGPRARYTRHRQRPPSRFDPRSFRTISIGKGQKAGVGCRKGAWDNRRRRCKIGTRIQTILKPKKGRR